MTEETLFTVALEKAKGAERAAFLDEVCAGHAALRRRVDALLASHEQTGFLRTPAVKCAVELFGGDGLAGQSDTRPTMSDEPVRAGACAEGLGTQIGCYKLLEQIGEGGMGTVWMAQQVEPVKRLVAVKLIKAGMDSKQIIARFEAERQALALMDHANIARVLDGGTTGAGRPYFVMDLVKGLPITGYCDDNRVTPRERLELFIPVCQAIQHAHQKGVIHRDLKPSNVLVAHYDGKPVPKVIDFGVAKAAGQALTEKTLVTGFGTIVGTVEYMSPEQAEINQLDIDTRSDIYSLGVLLYELLTGTTPFTKAELEKAGMLEMLRVIREQRPTKPSTKLRMAGRLSILAANRGTDPGKLTKMMRGELDWIVMKSLEKDRDRRFQSANGLGRDIDSYLRGEPVSACPPSAWYRFHKLARRNKALLASSCVIAGALLTEVVILAESSRRVHEKQLQTTAALEQTRIEKRQKSEQLWHALVAQARANRLSRSAGQRFETLEILRQATELARTLELPDERFQELRNAVITTLALPDLRLTGPWKPWPADAWAFDFDEAHAIYARCDRQGACSIRRVVDDVEIYHLPGLRGPESPHFSASLQLSRDGRFVAVIAHDPERKKALEVHLWHLNGVTPIGLLAEAQAGAVDFHRNGQEAALAYSDGSIGLFELPSGRQLRRLAPHSLTREVNIALHPTEPLVAVCSLFGPVVQIRDLRTGEVVASLAQTGGVAHAAWSRDGQTLAVCQPDPPLIRLYDRNSLQPYSTIEGKGAHVITFNRAGDRLAAVGRDRSLGLFDVGTGQLLFTTPPAVGAARFGLDGRRLAGAVQDGKLGIWEVGDGREYRTFVRKAMPAKAGFFNRPSVDPDGRLLAIAMTDGFGLWDLASGSELVFIPTGGMNNCVLFEPSGALLTLCPRGLFRWPVEKNPGGAGHWVMGPPERLPLPRGHELGQSRDGRVIVTCSRAIDSEQAYAGGWVLRCEGAGKPIRLDAGADIRSIAVSPDGRWVVTVTQATGLGKIWDARDGRLVKQLAEYGVGFPRFSPDGNWLSTDADGGRIFAVGNWEAGPRMGASAAFTPDNRLMAVQPPTGAVRLVELATGRELAHLEAPDFPGIASPVFTPDGTKLIGLGYGIRVWDLRLVRQQLAELGLDWDAPPYPAADSRSEPKQPLKVQILLGDLSKPLLTREQNARQCIELYRSSLERNPDNSETCNRLAWLYLTAPEPLRDVRAALRLAENAVRLAPGNELYGNTLGVAYYRAGRYREAAEALSTNLAVHDNSGLAFDLYFLAMSYHKLGEATRAVDYFNWAVRWTRADRDLSPANREELEMFRAEAEDVLGIEGRTEHRFRRHANGGEGRR